MELHVYVIYIYIYIHCILYTVYYTCLRLLVSRDIITRLIDYDRGGGNNDIGYYVIVLVLLLGWVGVSSCIWVTSSSSSSPAASQVATDTATSHKEVE